MLPRARNISQNGYGRDFTYGDDQFATDEADQGDPYAAQPTGADALSFRPMGQPPVTYADPGFDQGGMQQMGGDDSRMGGLTPFDGAPVNARAAAPQMGGRSVFRARRPGMAPGGANLPGMGPQPGGPPVAGEPGQFLNDEMQQAGGDARDANAAYTAGRGRVQGRINDVGGYLPSETQGFDPMASAGQAGDAVAGGMRSFDPNANLSGYETGGYDSSLEDFNPDFSGAGPSRLDDVNVGDFNQYGEGLDADPSAAINQFADTQNAQLKRTLGDTMEGVRNSNAAAGRINTGWFDQDRGQAIERVAGQFANAASDRAIAAGNADANFRLNRANTRGDLAAKGTSLALSRANSADALATDVAKTGNSLRFNTADSLDRNRLAASTQRNALGFDKASTMDANGMRRQQSVADLLSPIYGRAQTQAFDRAGNIDQARQRAGETALSAEQAATTGAGDYASRTREYGSEIAAGTLDREQARKNAEAQNKNAQWQTGINAAGSVADILDSVGGAKKAAGKIGSIAGVASKLPGASKVMGAVKGAAGRFGPAALGFAGGEAVQRLGGSNDATRIGGDVAKGAAIGSVIPGVGTAIGAVAGGAYGAVKKPVAKAARWLGSRLSDVGAKRDMRPTGRKIGGFPEYSYTIDGRHETGVLAQEVRAALPAAVETRPDGYLQVDYDAVVGA